MNERERQIDHYDPRPAYPPPQGTIESPLPTKIKRKERSSMGKFYVIICFVAFGLLLISGLLDSSARFQEEPDREDYEDDDGYNWKGENEDQRKASEKAYKDAVESHEDSVRTLLATTTLCRYCGAVALSFGLAIGAITDKSISKRTKLGMLIAAGIIIGLTFSPGLRIEDMLMS